MPNATKLRQFVYDRITVTGRPPSLAEVAKQFGTSVDGAAGSIRSLNIGKTVLPHPKTGEIWMAGPFSADPTAYRVICDGVNYYANCAWDMLGIPAIFGRPARIETVCTDCGEPMPMTVDPETGPDATGVVHFLLPARKWYDDIGFT
ncbi:MAG TPA: organomercurial lyase [Gemmatimonadaceae bacterium]